MYKNNIKTLLEQRDMTAYKLAKLTGISRQRLYPLVNAQELPSGTHLGTLRLIANALGVGVGDLEVIE